VNVGNLYHRLNRLEEALLHYERAAGLLENSADSEAAAGVMINRSVVLMLLYRFDEAHHGFLRAREYCASRGLSALATQSEYNRAYLLFLIGDYAKALKIMRTAESAFRDLDDKIHVAHCRSGRAEILLGLNLPEHALEPAGLAEQGYRQSGLNVDCSRAELLIGRCLMRLGRISEAGDHYSNARRLFHEGGNPLWASMADVALASTFLASGRFHEALDLASRAADFYLAKKHAPFFAVATTLAARASIELGDAGGALRLLNVCEMTLQSPRPASVHYDIQYLKGRALELDGQFGEAQECLRNGIDALEFLLTHISADQAMVRFLEDKEDIYERLAALTADPRQAFALVDRARTRAFDRFCSSRHAESSPTETVRQLRETLRTDYRKLFDAEQAQPHALFHRIQNTERQLTLELLDRELHRDHPLPNTRANWELELSGDEVLLEYFVRDNSVSVFAFSDRWVELVRLPISLTELENEVHLTRYGLLSPGSERREAALQFHLRRLYDALIEPVAPFLRNRIIFVPHRLLNGFPFHLLQGPEGYLAERHVVSYAPSASAYSLARRQDAPSFGETLIIGADSPNLPAVRQEVQAIAEVLPNCRVALNKGLREIRTSLERASVIHVASHALFRPDDPAWSLVDLGDDALSPADLLDLKVNASLVTMNACSTGKTNSRGNEAAGFVRAFSLWGVPSLVASLWEVHDESAALMMTSFYERLRHSNDIAGCLRETMLAVKDRFAHPLYWGGFVLIGRQTFGAAWNPFGDSKKQGSRT
jgi:CHAT domain-containing protein